MTSSVDTLNQGEAGALEGSREKPPLLVVVHETDSGPQQYRSVPAPLNTSVVLNGGLFQDDRCFLQCYAGDLVYISKKGCRKFSSDPRAITSADGLIEVMLFSSVMLGSLSGSLTIVLAGCPGSRLISSISHGCTNHCMTRSFVEDEKAHGRHGRPLLPFSSVLMRYYQREIA